MMPLTFLCLVLWLHFTHLHVLRASTTDAQQVLETTKVAYVAAPDGSVVSFHKELLDAAPAAGAVVSKQQLGGRKMVLGDISVMKDTINNGLERDASKISGISNNAPMNSLGSTEKNMNNQNYNKKTSSSASMGSLVADTYNLPNTNQLNFAVSSEVTPESHDEENESQKLLRASNEIANLMDVDYYSGWPQPRRTPPIHNSVPKDEDNAEP